MGTIVPICDTSWNLAFENWKSEMAKECDFRLENKHKQKTNSNKWGQDLSCPRIAEFNLNRFNFCRTKDEI